MGPTAVGKTQVALHCAEALDCSLISVDSAMVYRGMDVGTAKPSATVLQQYPHGLVDIRDPAEPYSVADFRTDALALIAKGIDIGKSPLLVGGTMLYFKALQQGLAPLPEAVPALRAQLLQEAQEKGWVALHEELQQVDPEAAARIHPNDPQRLQRALEVYRATGQSMTHWQQMVTNKNASPYQWLNVAIEPPSRDILRKRIGQRFHDMLAQGLLEEVRVLFERGDLTMDLPAMRAVGYRQIWQYLAGDCDYDTMVQRAITASCQLAKRQLTWLRRWPHCHWVTLDEAVDFIVAHYEKYAVASSSPQD
ncbi:MAG: tRNA (adenosine(37)-N6)-dimethylallyltransferase MiaA [Gammaproteobacteria bacterium]